MSSWGLLKSGLGWSETPQASSTVSGKISTNATPSTATQTRSISESLMSSSPRQFTEFAKSKPSEVTRTTAHSTSELLSRASSPRATENAGAEDDTLRLLRWEAAVQQVDKDSSEVMHQQWRLVCEQVATLSSKTISMRGEIKDLYRIASQEEAERRASVEAMQVALRISEERIIGMLEDLSRNQVSGMAIEMERAERISAFKKITEDLETEKSARLGACGELASEFSRLRNMLEENLQNSSNYMKEQSSIIETRVRDMEGVIRSELKQEMAERVKGDENCLFTLKQGLDKAKTEREDITLLIEALAKNLSQDYKSLLEERVSQAEALTRNLLQDETKARAASEVEFSSKMQSDVQRIAADLEREVAARTEVSSVTTDLQKQLQEEMKSRIASDEQTGKLLTEGFERAGSERSEILRMVDSIEVKIMQKCTSMLDDEVKVRVQGGEELMKNLQDGLEKAGRERSEVACMVDQADASLRVAMDEKVEQSCKVLRAEIDQALNEVATLKVEISALSGDKDTLDTVTREMRVMVDEHKQRTDQEWLSIQKSIQDHKEDYEEHKEAREAAHSGLQTDMERLWKSDIAQLRFDQDLVLQKLQVDYDTLYRQQEDFAAVVWKEELRRVWEAMDSHTHSVAVSDFGEKEEQSKTVVRREIVREMPQRMQPPQVQITAAGYQRYQDGRATVPVPPRGMIATNSTRAVARSINAPVGMRSPVMVSPPHSPDPARYSPGRARPAISATPRVPVLTVASSQKMMAVRPPTVERVDVIQQESISSGMWSPTVSSLHSPQMSWQDTQSSSVAYNLSGGMRRRDGSPSLTTQRGYAPAGMGRAVYDLSSNDSSTVPERREGSMFQPGKNSYQWETLTQVGTAVSEQSSDLDPEIRRDQ